MQQSYSLDLRRDFVITETIPSNPLLTWWLAKAVTQVVKTVGKVDMLHFLLAGKSLLTTSISDWQQDTHSHQTRFIGFSPLENFLQGLMNVSVPIVLILLGTSNPLISNEICSNLTDIIQSPWANPEVYFKSVG